MHAGAKALPDRTICLNMTGMTLLQNTLATTGLSPADLAQLADHGLSAAEAGRQLAQLRSGQHWTPLIRPCTTGDGICRRTESRQTELLSRFAEAAANGRITRFVPASGAATRMFQPLMAPQDDQLERFLAELVRFPFYGQLKSIFARSGDDLAAVQRDGDLPRLLAALLEPHGLGYARLPKGLLAFHQAGGEVRTAFVEHLAETAQLVGANQPARLHLTVSPEHLALFARQLEEWQEPLERRYGAPLRVSFSVQHPATDTLALGADGTPLRDADGRLVLRPGGHGALLANLATLDAEVVLIRNIDNVVPDARKGDNLLWGRLLGGMLLELIERQRALLEQLHVQPDRVTLREASVFLREDLGMEIPEGLPVKELSTLLDRPVRVCGMVRNSGEPGGGPFWVRGEDGRISRQIVEASQIDRSDPAQTAIFTTSTHFNPVDMACALHDRHGRPYPLERFVDQATALVSTKVQNGQSIRILERPGLWNGGMAGWHTVFVELPETTFNPVKTVFDLLRPAHQP